MRRVLRRLAALSERAVLSSLLLALAALLVYTDWLGRWNQVIYDLNIGLWSRRAPDDIVIVAIDERSLRELGRWPWSRRLHAALIDQLTRAGAKVIALDIAFAEPDAADPGADEALAAALKASSRVILPVLPEQTRLGGQLVETLSIPPLTQAAAGLGHVDVELDQDGVARGLYLKAGLGKPHWPALSLAMLERSGWPGAQHLPGVRAPPSAARLHQISPQLWVRDYHVTIPFAGPPGHFACVSYVDALRGEVPPGTFHDRFVLIGATATGIADALPTPVSAHAQPMPGVEFNANALDALLRGLTLRPLKPAWHALLTAALVLLPALVYPRLAPKAVLVVAVLLLLAALALCVLLLRVSHLWFAPMPALVALGLSYPLWTLRRVESATRSLADEKERARVTLHSISSGVITTNAEGLVEYMNPVAEDLIGLSVESARGRPLNTVLRLADSLGHDDDAVSQCLRQGQVISVAEYGRLVSRSGKEYVVQASVAPIRGQHGGMTGVVMALNDVTETQHMAQHIVYQAHHDALTDLPNCYLLLDRLSHAIARAQRKGRSIAALFLDLDQFKKVNDSLGHAIGDELLQAVARRLQDCVREEDSVARIGGDEFVIVLEHLCDDQTAAGVARKILSALDPPFVLQGHELFVTGSIGISLFPKDGRDQETLLRNADTAMYRAKEQGRNTFRFYAAEMNLLALERLTLENALRHALERNELLLYYQPSVELRDGRIAGVEALLRWRHPEWGLIAPARFIPLAEETGLILPIGEWVLRAACEQARMWLDQGLSPLRVAVNLSARQFLQPDLAGLVSRTLAQAGLQASCLELEITESLLMNDLESAVTTLRTLKAIGVQFAIDDFGTGYSSLSYLKRLPLDRLKIDRSFVCDITTDPDAAAIAQAVIALAQSMHLRVTAEGVETVSQLEFLRVRQCSEMQGFYCSPPVPAQKLTLLLRRLYCPRFD